MISWSKEDSISAIRRQHEHDPLPLRIHGQVITALDGVSDGDHEIRTIGGRLTPDLLIHSRDRLPGAIAQDGKPKCGAERCYKRQLPLRPAGAEERR